MNSPTKILIKQKTTFRNLPPMLLLVMVSATAFASTTWYVDGLHGNDSNNCKSPSTSCKTIHHAIALAHSGDSIMVAAATYVENLTIGISLNVIGSSAATTIIDGGGVNSAVRLPTTTATVVLSGLTIRNGHATVGGGVSNSGILTITNTTISWNEACCVYRSGGGGIYNLGTLTIYNSTVSGNSATGWCFYSLRLGLRCFGGEGGGIYSEGRLTINNSSVSGNEARCPFHFNFHPPCFASPEGGGIDNYGTLTLSNSTISRNGVGTGGGGGGISGTATLQNSIVAYNPGGNCSGTMISNGYNMSSDSTCGFSKKGDWNSTDPMLGPLQNNGGQTQTMALPLGSPAIDAGNPSGCTDGSGHLLTTDQRGQRRPDKDDKLRCDIGAYERQSD